MSWPNIDKCYYKIVKDPSLLWLFPEKECTSLGELPLFGTLQFRLICITHTSQKISGEATSMVILGKLGYGDHLLPPRSSQNLGLWHTLQPTSMWLTGAKHCCSEKIHQHPLYPLQDFPFPLSRCDYPFQGCFHHPMPTGLALIMQATPFLWG